MLKQLLATYIIVQTLFLTDTCKQAWLSKYIGAFYAIFTCKQELGS